MVTERTGRGPDIRRVQEYVLPAEACCSHSLHAFSIGPFVAVGFAFVSLSNSDCRRSQIPACMSRDEARCTYLAMHLFRRRSDPRA